MKIAVIGGGIQGIGAALELARRGARVDLIERRGALMLGASRENEGKVHLGFVYANDDTLETARLMSAGAFSFGPTLARWLERDVSTVLASRPFHYAVHRDSLLDPDDLAGRYEAIGRLVRSAASQPGTDYFGVRDAHRARRLSRAEAARLFDDRLVRGAFETAEIAIDPDAVADQLVARVTADPRVEVRTGTRVVAARQLGSRVRLTLDIGGEEHTEEYHHVVNCAWCGRVAIDATIGVRPEGPWSFRRKRFLRVPAPATAEVPSVTIVLGGFGDVVRYAGGDLFLSWYPVGCLGIERGLTPNPAPPDSPDVREGIVERLREIVPSLGGVSPDELARGELRSGVIFALGTTDVDDPASLFHRRCAVGPRSFGRYHTVDTGKYTLAPLFAEQVAERILPARAAA
jgi:glycine/D-amino acid oxidase-like deaminating enzyme